MLSASDSGPMLRRAKSNFLSVIMPKVTIHNRTKAGGTALPNGVKLKIAVGDKEQNLDVGKSGTFNVSQNQVIKIEPANRMMQKTNWTQPDGKDRNLYIIPSDQDGAFGVKIVFNDPDS